MRSYENAFFWLEESRVAMPCYTATAVNTGLDLLRGDKFKLYLSDTGLLISMAFQERNSVVEVYQKLLKNKLELNKGMLMENVVAQMLRASGHHLYFYSKASTHAEERIEIDFLLRKTQVTSRKNMIPVEVKSSTRYSLVSLEKCHALFGQQIHIPVVLHTSDLKEEAGILYLPLYMTPLL